MHPSEAAWKNYIEQIATGSDVAMARLYEESNRIVYGLLMRILGNTADAEEVCLDVYLQVWQTAKTFDSQRSRGATGWLMMLARSRAIDRLRSSATRQKQERNDPASYGIALRRQCTETLPDLVIESNQQSETVLFAMRQLNAKEREIMELAFFGGLSHADIAKALQQPLGTIKTYIRRALIKLRREFTENKHIFVAQNGRNAS